MIKGIFTAILAVSFLSLLSGCTVNQGAPPTPAGPSSSGGPVISPVTPPPPLPENMKSVTVSIVGGGQVLFNGIGMCNALTTPCTFTVLKTSSPILTILPTPEVAFYSWDNCTEPIGTVCYSLSSDNQMIVANFAPYSNPSPLPSVSISDASVNEGGHLDFLVTQSAMSTTDSTFSYSTADGTATSSVNYTSLTGTLTIAAGTTTAHILISTTDDLVVGPSLIMTLNLSSAVNVILTNLSATGTILNIDTVAPPAVMQNITAQTQLNAPINLQGALSIGNNFSGVYMDANKGTSVTTSFGTLTVIDAVAMTFSFTPALAARGDADFTVYVFSGTVSTTAKIRVSIDNPLANLQPGLAVRASGCIMCHSNIQSNIITDFGFGDPWFFGQQSNNPWDFGSVYANQEGNWENVTVSGKIIVPHGAVVPSSVLSSLTYEYQADKLPPIVNSVSSFLHWQLSSLSDGTKTPVAEATSIFIGAPTAARLRVAANQQPTDGVIKFIPDDQTVPALSGLTVMNGTRPDGTTGQYVTNDPTVDIVCNGDVLIDSVLLLDQPKINTVNGCRLYVTQSTFLQAPIVYTNSSPTTNLQITSAKAILAGLGWNDCGVDWRDDEVIAAGHNHSILGRVKEATWQNPNTYVRNLGTMTPQQYENSIYQDALLIPRANLIDANCQTTNSTPFTLSATTVAGSDVITVASTANLAFGMKAVGSGIPTGATIDSVLSPTTFSIGIGTEGDQPATISASNVSVTFSSPRNVPLNHIFLDAPIVQSRYNGNVTGVIVAEYSLLGLNGELSYGFDPNFLVIPVLPLLQTSEYLDVVTSGSTVDNNLPPVANFSYRHFPVNRYNHRVDFYPFSRHYNSAPLTYDPDGTIASITFDIAQISPNSIDPFIPAPKCQVGSQIQADDHLCREDQNGAFYSVTIGSNYGQYQVTETVTDALGATATNSQTINITQASETEFHTGFTVVPFATSIANNTTVTFTMKNDAANAALTNDYEYRWNVTAADVSGLDLVDVINPCDYPIAGQTNGSIYYYGVSLTQTFNLSVGTIYQNAACPAPWNGIGVATPNTYNIQMKFTDWLTGITIFNNYTQEVGF